MPESRLTLPALKERAFSLGITEDALKESLGVGRVTKSDYARAIGMKSTGDRASGYMLDMKSVMLCARYKELSESQKKEIWYSDEWVIEEKLDGVRFLGVTSGGEFHAFGRYLGDDCLPVDYRNHLLDRDGNNDYYSVYGMPEFVFDGEIVPSSREWKKIMEEAGYPCESGAACVETILAMPPKQAVAFEEMHGLFLDLAVFDILMYHGTWVTEKPLIERVGLLEDVLYLLNERLWLYARRPLSSYSAKPTLYRCIAAARGEGCVFKNILSPYNTEGGRKKDGWVKVKPTMGDVLSEAGVDDWIEGYVSGIYEAYGTITGVHVSTNVDGDPRIIADVPLEGMPESLANIESIGTVVRITGHGLGIDGIMKSPQIIGVVEDKASGDVNVSKEKIRTWRIDYREEDQWW